jgi:hypothetical protein
MSHRHADGTRKNARDKPATVRARLGRGMANGIPGSTKGSCVGRRVTSGHANGDTPNADTYLPPALANPGNVIKCKVGGNLLGHPLAHENEAPFPLLLAEFFVRSFCPPGGLVIDPFAGSCTTGHAAKKWGRAFAGCDIRESQVELGKRRLASVTTELFA